MGMSENGVYPQWNSHLVGIMIINHWVFRGTLFSDKPISIRFPEKSSAFASRHRAMEYPQISSTLQEFESKIFDEQFDHVAAKIYHSININPAYYVVQREDCEGECLHHVCASAMMTGAGAILQTCTGLVPLETTRPRASTCTKEGFWCTFGPFGMGFVTPSQSLRAICM